MAGPCRNNVLQERDGTSSVATACVAIVVNKRPSRQNIGDVFREKAGLVLTTDPSRAETHATRSRPQGTTYSPARIAFSGAQMSRGRCSQIVWPSSASINPRHMFFTGHPWCQIHLPE